MGEKSARSRKRVYGLIVVIFGVCICISALLAFACGIKAPVQPLNTDLQRQSLVIPIPTNNTGVTNQTNITKDRALKIAMPIIEQYAAENNRTITNITVTFGWSPDDGSREGLTLPQVLAENLSPIQANNQFSYFPSCAVDATFK